MVYHERQSQARRIYIKKNLHYLFEIYLVIGLFIFVIIITIITVIIYNVHSTIRLPDTTVLWNHTRFSIASDCIRTLCVPNVRLREKS